MRPFNIRFEQLVAPLASNIELEDHDNDNGQPYEVENQLIVFLEELRHRHTIPLSDEDISQGHQSALDTSGLGYAPSHPAYNGTSDVR